MTTHPIAGAGGARSAPVFEDAQLANAQERTSKERAEHVMLVDLGRTTWAAWPAGAPWSFTKYMEVERYSTCSIS